MSKERRLGRGLEALLGRSYPDSPNPGGSPCADLSLHVPDGEPLGDAGTAIVDELPADAPPPTGTLAIAIQEIRTNPFQPRRDFDPEEITALADSLRQHGLIQPILVRRAADGYQLIAGERRLRAATEAGWTEVPVQIREADDRQMAELAIVENLQRKDLNPLEKAGVVRAVFATLRLHAGRASEPAEHRPFDDRQLDPLVGTAGRSARRDPRRPHHARPRPRFLPLGDEREQVAFCERIQAEGLSVRATEQTVQDQIHAGDAGPLGVVAPEGAAKPRANRAAAARISPRWSKNCGPHWARK